MTEETIHSIRQRLRHAEANLAYSLECFGDSLAKRESWKNRLDGLEAVQYYLMQKHHWLPAQVKAMTFEDLRFAMTEELADWTLPKEARLPAGQ